MKDINKFVILFPARSGSTFLAAALNKHSKIACSMEIFNPNAVHNPTLPKLKELSVEDYIEYVMRLHLERKIEMELYGYKLCYHQIVHYPELFDIIPRSRYKVIHMYRKKALERIVSFMLALRTGIWSKVKDAEETSYDTTQLFLRRRKAINKIKEDQAQLDKYRSVFKNSCAYYEVCYEDLFGANSKKVLEDLQKWLGVIPEDITSILKKQNKRPLKDILVNYSKLSDLEKIEIS